MNQTRDALSTPLFLSVLTATRGNASKRRASPLSASLPVVWRPYPDPGRDTIAGCSVVAFIATH